MLFGFLSQQDKSKKRFFWKKKGNSCSFTLIADETMCQWKKKVFLQKFLSMTSKTEIRSAIKALKKQHSKEELQAQSELIMRKLEQHPDFLKAQKIMLYSSLPDEVQTQAFIEKWRHQKHIILPTVVGDDIIPVELAANTGFAVGDFNILEPQNDAYHGDFDLIVVPGVAFDRMGNRMGRGRGFYDRLLKSTPQAVKVGVAYGFQLLDEIPVEPHDVKMNAVIHD